MMIIIKTFLISLIYLAIKSITLLILLLIFLINLESNKIINSNKNDTSERVGNCEFRPIIFYSTPENTPIGAILYYKYRNEVFNLTYMKIKIGKKGFWLKIFKSMNLKKILKIIFYFYIEISRIFILLSKEIINYKEDKLEDYLLKKYSNPWDDRLILKINGKWEINGLLDILTQRVKNDLLKKNTMSTEKILYLEPQIILMLERNLNNFAKVTKDLFVKRGFLIDKSTKIAHSHIMDINKENKNVALITDHYKSLLNAYYGRQLIIGGVELNKKSDLLNIDKKEVIFTNSNYKLNSIPLLKAANINGYNEKLISDEFLNQIITFNQLNEDMYTELLSLTGNEIIASDINNMIMDEFYKNVYKGLEFNL